MRIRGKEAWLLAAFVVLFFHRPLTTETFFFRDLYQMYYPKKLLLMAFLRSGELPLWDSTVHAGQPFLASPNNAVLQPANVLYFILPTIWAFNIAIVLHLLLCALGAWWLARLLGLSPAAAFTTGAVFAFCGYTLSAASLLLVFALPAFPFAVAFLHLAVRGSRRAIGGAAVAIAWPLLSGGPEAFGVLIVTLLAWTAATTARKNPRPLVLAVLFGIGLSLVQIVPATEVIRNSSRSQRRPFESFSAWSLDPRRLPELIVPRFFGDTGRLDDRAYWGRHLETEGFPYILSLYFGALTLILATYGAFARKDDIPRKTLFALAVLGVVLSLGRWLPLLRAIYDVIPILGMFRFPVKAMELSLLPIAILAGCGIDGARREVSGETASARHGARMTLIAAAIVSLATALWFSTSTVSAAAWAQLFFREPWSPFMRTQLSHSLWHVTIVLAIAAGIASARRVPAGTALAALVLADLAVAGISVNMFAPRSLFDEPPMARRMRSLIGDGRFYSGPGPAALDLRAPSDDLMWLARWKIETLSGYSAATFGVPVVFTVDYDDLEPLPMARLTRLVGRSAWPQRLPILRAAGVRAFTTVDKLALPGVVEVAVLRSAEAHPLYVYAIPDSAPAYFRGQNNCGPAPVRLIRRTFNTSEWSVNAPCRGDVVIADTWYPGWRAFVDGNERTLERANGAFSAVAVERGPHTITKRYEPRLVLVGAIASALAMIGLIAVSREGSAAPP